MNLRDSPDEEAFRARVRAWLAENLPEEQGGREWSRKLFDAGYAGLTWPVEYGGLGEPYSHQAIALEEFARAEAPNHMNVIALGMAGPTIMAHGTEEQKRRYLPKMLSAEEIWCQGFSEPDAGSDLSAVR
ncbi:MAG: acyl-CoA dehydrogenase family protein, partial [Gaiellaceae bacterium]